MAAPGGIHERARGLKAARAPPVGDIALELYLAWKVSFGDAFDAEFGALPQTVQDELLASAKLLGAFGPALGRPHADTPNESRFANMEELRFSADGGVWRVAFAFDPAREAILLVAGDKSGNSEKRFYRTLIAKPDRRYQAHLDRLTAAKRETT